MSPTPPTDVPVAGWRRSLFLPWFAVVLPLTALSLVSFVLTRSHSIANVFFFQQDLAVVLATGLGLMLLRFAPLGRLAAAGALLAAEPKRVVGGLAGACAIIAGAGWFVVCHAYPFSMDEFMAVFDGAIWRTGRPYADLPAAWAGYGFPLQPQFVLHLKDGAAWASSYLPVNALLRAGFGLVGAAWAAGAVYAAVSVAAVYALGRRLWPERPDAAVVAALLLATSSQFLVMAMTPYAMSAHLAFNLVWLVLFLRPGRASDIGAIAVGALACGLHQLVFHPLFVAPFILGLWLERRWGRAAFYTGAYAAITLFWAFYWTLVLPGPGSATAHGASDLGGGLLVQRVLGLLVHFNPASIDFMSKNLVRFVVWQNPLATPLALLGAVAALRARGPFPALIGGFVLTLAVVWVLEPYQGHGWGYRYLHGCLGSVALVAAFGWVRLTERLAPSERPTARAAMGVVAALSLLVLAPWQAFQTGEMIRPYAAAARAIARTPAEVVLIDPSRLFFATDLVRNDPLLRNQPKTMDLGVMTAGQIRGVCAAHRVALFEQKEGLALGIEPDPEPSSVRMLAARKILSGLNCGERTVPIGP